jgi:hypothetical protein
MGLGMAARPGAPHRGLTGRARAERQPATDSGLETPGLAGWLVHNVPRRRRARMGSASRGERIRSGIDCRRHRSPCSSAERGCRRGDSSVAAADGLAHVRVHIPHSRSRCAGIPGRSDHASYSRWWCRCARGIPARCRGRPSHRIRKKMDRSNCSCRRGPHDAGRERRGRYSDHCDNRPIQCRRPK